MSFDGFHTAAEGKEENGKITLYNLKHFDIQQIANSGQCFRITPHPDKPNTFRVIAHGRYLEVYQEKLMGSSEVEMSCSWEEYDKIWKKYFDLDSNYQYYIDHIDPDDAFLKAAVAAGDGIRILRQDIWETIVSFMISQNNNIPRIKKTIEGLCEFYGKGHMEDDGYCWHEFPTPEDMKEIDEEAMQALGFGYRDKYIKKLVENVLSGEINLDILTDETLEDSDIENYLKSIYGIGAKVASCIMLFGLHRIDSLPKDTWINKIIHEEYNGKFPVDMYAGFVGVIQQYMFNYAISRDKEEV